MFFVAEKPKNDYNNKNQSSGNSPIKVELQNNMDRWVISILKIQEIMNS